VLDTAHQSVETFVPRPIHFEIHAADPERVQQFYGALFGCYRRSSASDPGAVAPE
jgi:predicted enzyme related to lactoylglutathione lyase